MKKIGVFICHCGINIANTVDVEKVTKALAEYPGVVRAGHYTYMCSDPGQNLVKESIDQDDLDGVVVAACSPNLHLNTFRRASESAGLNPYLCEQANIREQCSWVHGDRDDGTAKATRIIEAMVEKVRRNEPLKPVKVPVTKRALVLGGGISGMQAALDIANSGYETLLVERNPSIGGHMIQLSETFPTLDCSQCIMTPKMVEVGQHPSIKLHTYSELDEEGLSGVEREIADAAIGRYGADSSSLVQVMQDINQEYRYLPENVLKYVSERLGVPLPQVYHVATFYTAFSLEPRGEHTVKVCVGTACHARGAEQVLDEMERLLGIPPGGTTPDLKFTLETVNCLGCCALGPVVVIDEDYHSVKPSKIEGLLKGYR